MILSYKCYTVMKISLLKLQKRMLGLGREDQDGIKELEITETEVLHATVGG